MAVTLLVFRKGGCSSERIVPAAVLVVVITLLASAQSDGTGSQAEIKTKGYLTVKPDKPSTHVLPQDPGPRSTPGASGGPLPSCTAKEQAYFVAARARFLEQVSISGSLVGERGSGLGPGYNATSCAQCHAFPTVGGSSPPTNPQIAVANLDGATNKVPTFI